MSALAIGALAVACGDDEDPAPSTDGDADGTADGDTDGGGDEDGDAGEDLPAGAIKCGENTCTRIMLTTGPLAACCTEDNSCGLVSTNLAGANKPECVLKDAPGVASASCGAAWDFIDEEAEAALAGDAGVPDGGTPEDGTYTTVRAVGATSVALQFNGCCTAAGSCSISFKDPAINFGGQDIGATDLGYGCADPAHVGIDEGSRALGFGDTITCDPATGMVMEQPQTPGGDAGTDAGTGDAGTDGGA